MTTTTALVATGIVSVCCGSHQAAGCCDADDCAPCCPECPTCPLYRHWSPQERRDAAARCREYLADLIAMRRAAGRAWDQHRREVAAGDPTPIYAGTIADTGIVPTAAALLWPDIELDQPPFSPSSPRHELAGGAGA